MTHRHWLWFVTAVSVTALVISGIRPYDRVTWVMEVAPVLIALPVMWASGQRFPLTPLLYACILLHALV